jgi:hypothetical protein
MTNWPTADEIARVIRDGTLIQVADAMVMTCCSHDGLRKRYRQLFTESRTPEKKCAI